MQRQRSPQRKRLQQKKKPPTKEIKKIDIKTLVTEKCGAILEEKVKDTMLAMFVNKNMIASFAEPIEQLVLSVMKKELQAVVNLGALIGFVIGLINLIVL